MTYLLENYDVIVLRKWFKGQIVNLVNDSKKFILNNHIVHKYRYKIDIKIDVIKSMNIYNIYIIIYIIYIIYIITEFIK